MLKKTFKQEEKDLSSSQVTDTDTNSDLMQPPLELNKGYMQFDENGELHNDWTCYGCTTEYPVIMTPYTQRCYYCKKYYNNDTICFCNYCENTNNRKCTKCGNYCCCNHGIRCPICNNLYCIEDLKIHFEECKNKNTKLKFDYLFNQYERKVCKNLNK